MLKFKNGYSRGSGRAEKGGRTREEAARKAEAEAQARGREKLQYQKAQIKQNLTLLISHHFALFTFQCIENYIF